ncbi:helix-turn-helix domain-containing protein [Fodinicola acaciae]|uniref:helix-turn-helix domain-containing protein n=1 Tax=Fodinicola acaciae TaxID=2681555 RepID=UPI001C9E6A52|nr:helix-turn-helix transcriptional regulator [Fodinicola acaciae]
MPSVTGPIIPRRRLAAALRRLRESAGLSLTEVADELMISKSKLSRLENAQGNPQARDVRDLIRLYRVDGTPEAGNLMRWARSTTQTAWWSGYRYDDSGFASDLKTHVEYESEAVVARIYTIPFVPALLQTEAYARALYRSIEPWRSAEDIDQLVKLRLRRQEVLARRDREPLRLEAVMHECAVHQFVGSGRIVHEQLAALLTLPEHVALRVLPFSAAPVFASTCMWALLVFDEELDTVVHVETHAGFRFIQDRDQVCEYGSHFVQLWRRSLDEEESRSFIGDAMRAWLRGR